MNIKLQKLWMWYDDLFLVPFLVFNDTCISGFFLVGSVLLIFLVVCVLLLCVFTFWAPCCDVYYEFRIKRWSIYLYLQLIVGGSMSCLWEGACLVCVVCVCLRVVSHACIVLCFCFVFTRFAYPMLPVSLDCPYLIAPSVFSNVYWH